MNQSQITHAEFVNRLELFMKKTNKKGYELAEAAGIKPQAISGYKNNHSFPKAEVLAAWAKEFDLNISWLLLDDGEMLRSETPGPGTAHEIENATIMELKEQVATLQADLLAEKTEHAERVTELKYTIELQQRLLDEQTAGFPGRVAAPVSNTAAPLPRLEIDAGEKP